MSGKRSKIIFAAFVVVILLCAAGIAIYKYFNTGNAALEKAYNKQISLYSQISPNNGDSSESQSETEEQASSAADNLLKDAQEINADTVGWITIPDTPIDFPIVQTSDNSYYLTHDFEKQESDLGVPFLDYRNTFDFSDFNSIVYGHNMDEERMFRCVNYFQEQEYFDAHLTGTLTVEDRVYTVAFFCCARVESDSELYQEICITNSQKTSFLETLEENAVCMREFQASELLEKKLLILSTCTYAEGTERTILVGYLP